jgi:hypothetical protein
VDLHRYEVLETQSGQSYSWCPISAGILHFILIFISLCPVHNSPIIAEHKVKSSLSIPPCHNHQLTPSTAYTEYSIHNVQHTPSTAYTNYIIHQVQHTPSTASTNDGFSSLHSHDYKLTLECSFSFWSASLHDRPPSNQLFRKHQRERQLLTVPWLRLDELMNKVWAPSAPSFDCIQILVQTRSITASKCISNLAQSRPPISYRHTRLIMVYKCIS